MLSRQKFSLLRLPVRAKEDLRSIELTRLHPVEQLGSFDRGKVTDLINHACN